MTQKDITGDDSYRVQVIKGTPMDQSTKHHLTDQAQKIVLFIEVNVRGFAWLRGK